MVDDQYNINLKPPDIFQSKGNRKNTQPSPFPKRKLRNLINVNSNYS